MQLGAEHLRGWLEVAHPEATDVEARLDRMRSSLGDPAWCADRFVEVRGGQVMALTWLFETGPGQLGLGAPRTRGGAPIGDADTPIVDEALRSAALRGVGRVGMRLPEERWTDAIERLLARTGGREVQGRVEYKTPLTELAHEEPGPVSFGPVDVPTAARILAMASEGTDDGLEPGEDPEEVVRSWLSDHDFASDPAACLHVGTLDGEAVALVCAQVAPSDGWSTLTFMGLVPAARGRGLGHQVQRHGLAMLRAQGGKLYHGGTSLGNAAMRACFVAQGCREWQRFRQLQWQLH